MAQQQGKEELSIIKQLLNYIPEAEIIQTTEYTLKQNEYKEERTYMAKSKLRSTQQNVENYHNMNKAKETLLEGREDQLKSQINKLFVTFKPKYEVGDQVQETQDLNVLDIDNNTSKPAIWMPKQGMVTIMYFWDIHNQESCEEMTSYLSMLESHEDWVGKVEFIGFSLCNESEKIIKYLKENNATNMKHYYFTKKEEYENCTLSCMNINNGIPMITMFNQQCEIVVIGSNQIYTLEYTIPDLLQTTDKQLMNQQIEQQEPQQDILLNKADFKILKGKIRAEMQKLFKGLRLLKSTFKVSFTKSNTLSSIGKVPLQRTKATVEYNVRNDEKDKLDQFLKFINDNLSLEMISFGTTTTFDDPNFGQIIKQVCKNNGVQVVEQSKKSYQYIFVHNEQSLSLQIDKKDAVKVQNTNSIIVDNIFTELENSLGSIRYKQFARSYNPYKRKILEAIKLSINDKYIPIENYLKVGTDKSETIQHKQGQILVICYYIHDKNETEIINQTDALLQQNRINWGDKVRTVVLCSYYNYKYFLDDTQQIKELEIYEKIKDYPIDAVLYGVKRGSYHPHCVIVDAEGRIQYMGKLLQLEETINNLQIPKHKQVDSKDLCNEQIKQLTKFLEQSKQAFPSFGSKYLFKFKLMFKTCYEDESDDAKFIKANQPTLKYWVRQDKVEQLNKVLSQLFEIVPKEQFKLTETISKTFDVPFPGTECILCNAVLTDQIPQYYSPFKNEFVCAPCAEFDDQTQIGLARYKYTDTLIFINAPLTDLSQLKGIDEFKIGKNKKIPIGEVGEEEQQTCCQRCDYGKTPRYISLSDCQGKLKKSWRFKHGIYSDFCQECFNTLKDKNSNEAQAIFKKKKKNGMSQDGLFVRILFNTGYYDF